MRIFYFITKSEQGGAQTHVAQLTQCFLLQGHEVAVMSAPGGWLEEETKRLGVTFYPNITLANTANPLRLWTASRVFLQSIQAFQPNVVACHSTMAGLLGRFTLRNRLPTIFTAHGWSFTDGAKFYRRMLLPMIERTAARYCSKIICVSQNDLRLAQKYRIAPEEKLMMIYNGIDPAPEIASSSRSGGTPRNDGIVEILFIGRLAEPKDPSLLINAIANLPSDMRTHVHLTLIGDGPRKANVQKMIDRFGLNDQITLTGALPHQDVLETLKTADLFVLPTRYEGFPYTILEAMAHGVPVVASDVGGVREAVGDDTGILVPPNDVTALKNALERLISNPELRAQMGAAGCHKAETQFSLETMCKRTLEVYRSVL